MTEFGTSLPFPDTRWMAALGHIADIAKRTKKRPTLTDTVEKVWHGAPTA